MQRILELADVATIHRNRARDGPLGTLLTVVMSSADPDARFQECVRPMLRGERIQRRRKITELAVLFGIEKRVMKGYLRAAGIVNEMD